LRIEVQRAQTNGFFERPFALHRQQPEKDKQNLDVVAASEKILRTSMDALISRSNSRHRKRGAVWLNSFKLLKNDKCQCNQFI